MYITVLDYSRGKVTIEEISDNIFFSHEDFLENYIEDNYDYDNCHYMTTAKLDLNILTIENN
jgi:hypothetical protein